MYKCIAEGYDIPYSAVTERADLKAEVEKMINTDGPYILECAIKEEDNVMPMTPLGKPVDEMLLEI